MTTRGLALNRSAELAAAGPRPLALPFAPLEMLAGRSRRLANLVESVSRRRDVRELRARLLVLLIDLRCPPGGRPRRPWYVPGAVARLGLEALRRAWRGFYGLEAPCVRTLRAHLGLLERACAIVRQPGDWIEGFEGEKGAAYRPRHADTLHVLDDEDAAEAWERRGLPALRAHPEARTNPHAWRRRVAAAWRKRAEQPALFPVQGLGIAVAYSHTNRRPARPEGLPDQVGGRREVGEQLARVLRALDGQRDRTAAEALAVLQDAGVTVHGRPSFELAADRSRLEGAAWLLVHALRRGDAVRSLAAWLVRAFHYATSRELEHARARGLG